MAFSFFIVNCEFENVGVFESLKLLNMKNCSENSPSYVLFGKEALQLYNVSTQNLLNAINIDYNVNVFTKIKNFEEEKIKWNDCVEIDYHEYLKIKSHLDKQPSFFLKIKKKLLLGIFS